MKSIEQLISLLTDLQKKMALLEGLHKRFPDGNP